MKKSIIIALVIVVVAVLAVAVYFVLRGAAQPGGSAGGTGTLPPVATGTTGPAPGNGTSSFPTGSTFQIGTSQGSVTVNNFYGTMDYITEDDETVVLAENDNYSISYYRPDSGFIIVFTSVPAGTFQTERAAAESAFLSQLGISQSDACKLSVNERVTDNTSPYDGELMGLSFCPSTPSQ